MIEGLQEAFLGKFLTIARARLARAFESAAHPEQAGEVARELHSLAGEAGLLGISDVVPLAREGEELARQIAMEPTGTATPALRAVIDQLNALVEAMASRVKGGP